MAACPVCGRLRAVRRSMLAPHRAGDGRRRCPGSGQRFQLDLTPVQWLARLDAATRDAAARRRTDLVYRRPRLRTEPAS
jgi:hypothetical protein